MPDAIQKLASISPELSARARTIAEEGGYTLGSVAECILQARDETMAEYRRLASGFDSTDVQAARMIKMPFSEYAQIVVGQRIKAERANANGYRRSLLDQVERLNAGGVS